MVYLLDTNAAIALLKEHPQMLGHVRRVGQSALRVCAPVEAELWFGVGRWCINCKLSPTSNRIRGLS